MQEPDKEFVLGTQLEQESIETKCRNDQTNHEDFRKIA